MQWGQVPAFSGFERDCTCEEDDRLRIPGPPPTPGSDLRVVPGRLVVLIPPSLGTAPGGDGPPWEPGSLVLPELDPAREKVLDALGPRAPRFEPTLPAIERFTGVLYRELDAGSLAGPARRRLRSSVLIASGLFGLVAPSDPVPDVRLAMGDSLEGLGKLSTWWRPHLVSALAPRVKGATVWDLLPAEHEHALDWSGLAPRRRVTIRFVDHRDKVVAHWNKLLKGSIVRWLAETGARDPGALADFEHPQGYRLDEADSTWTDSRVELVMRQMAQM